MPLPTFSSARYPRLLKTLTLSPTQFTIHAITIGRPDGLQSELVSCHRICSLLCSESLAPKPMDSSLKASTVPAPASFFSPRPTGGRALHERWFHHRFGVHRGQSFLRSTVISPCPKTFKFKRARWISSEDTTPDHLLEFFTFADTVLTSNIGNNSERKGHPGKG